MAPKKQMVDWVGATANSLAKRKRQAQEQLIDYKGIPRPPPRPPSSTASASASAASSASPSASGSAADAPPNVISNARDELHALRFANTSPFGFSPQRYTHIICGRPVVVLPFFVHAHVCMSRSVHYEFMPLCYSLNHSLHQVVDRYVIFNACACAHFVAHRFNAHTLVFLEGEPSAPRLHWM